MGRQATLRIFRAAQRKLAPYTPAIVPPAGSGSKGYKRPGNGTKYRLTHTHTHALYINKVHQEEKQCLFTFLCWVSEPGRY